jgi:hypothetical protein
MKLSLTLFSEPTLQTLHFVALSLSSIRRRLLLAIIFTVSELKKTEWGGG